MFLSKKSLCVCDVSVMGNQLKMCNVDLSDYSKSMQKLPLRYICLDIIDYIHIYIFTLHFSHER